MWIRKREQALLLRVLPLLEVKCVDDENMCTPNRPVAAMACKHLRDDLHALQNRIHERYHQQKLANALARLVE
jgi:hypothetical protein